MTTTVSVLCAGRTLVPEELFARLTRRIAADERVQLAEAEQIMSDALAFLAACAVHRGEPLSPSARVDIGWHAFILHTRDYAEFCDRIAGRFLHHIPAEGDMPAGSDLFLQMNRTMRAIVEAGFAVTPELWLDDAKCTQCHNGCYNDPPPDPPPNVN
jgi:hypothetical protein